MAIEPITRAEQIMSGESLEPITREEMFLAKAAGMDVETPTPITRREMFLSQISGGNSGGGSGEYEAMLAGMIDGTATSVTIPKATTAIKEGAFKNFTALQSIVIPDGVTAIGQAAFFGCTALKSVVIPGSVASIHGGYSGPNGGQFSECTALESVAIEDGVQSLGGAVFYNCTGLKTVEFRGITTFSTASGFYPFRGCTALTDIYVPWAEGEVAGAPWDATNATIHYNHTGG